MSTAQLFDITVNLIIKSIELAFKAFGYLLGLGVHSSVKMMKESDRKHEREQQNPNIARLLEYNAVHSLYLLGAKKQPREGTIQYNKRRVLVVKHVNETINAHLTS